MAAINFMSDMLGMSHRGTTGVLRAPIKHGLWCSISLLLWPVAEVDSAQLTLVP